VAERLVSAQCGEFVDVACGGCQEEVAGRRDVDDVDNVESVDSLVV
jgi:hypothetical protein